MLVIIGWMIFGLIIGLIARALYPGPQPLGFGATVILGIIGSLTGGAFSWLLFGTEFHSAGAILSVCGAMALIYFGFVGAQRAA